MEIRSGLGVNEEEVKTKLLAACSIPHCSLHPPPKIHSLTLITPNCGYFSSSLFAIEGSKFQHFGDRFGTRKIVLSFALPQLMGTSRQTGTEPKAAR